MTCGWFNPADYEAHLAQHADRCASRELRKVDRRLGVPAPRQHTAGAGTQRKNVTGPDRVRVRVKIEG